jgi:hypothetical protein
MDSIDLTRKCIRFQKNLFRSTYSAMVIAHERADKTTSMLLEGAFWIPEEGIDVIREWRQAFKQWRDQWKRCVDDKFQSFEKLFS